jgi:hypothetical protein
MMQHSRLSQVMLSVVAVLLCLTFARPPMPAQAAEGQAKVDRLVMGLIYPFPEPSSSLHAVGHLFLVQK